MEVLIQKDLSKEIETLKEISENLNNIEKTTEKLTFLTIEDFSKITKWSKKTVQDLFNRQDFPSCDFGKSKIVEINACRDYFKIARRR